MSRNITILFLCAGISCCQEKQREDAIVEESFGITKGQEQGIVAMRSIAYEAQAFQTAKAQSNAKGWKAVGGTITSIPVATTFKNETEELNFYSHTIFQSLGYPLQEHSGAKLVMKSNQEVLVSHRKMALTEFQMLLDRWRRSREDIFKDMLDGTMKKANKAEMATPRKPSD